MSSPSSTGNSTPHMSSPDDDYVKRLPVISSFNHRNTRAARPYTKISKRTMPPSTQKHSLGDLWMGANNVQRDKMPAVAKPNRRLNSDIVGNESPLFSREIAIPSPMKLMIIRKSAGMLIRRITQIFCGAVILSTFLRYAVRYYELLINNSTTRRGAFVSLLRTIDRAGTTTALRRSR